MSSLNKSLVNQAEARDVATTSTPPQTPTRSTAEDNKTEGATQPVDIRSLTVEDPIDRKALASTPLLPKPLIERRGSDEDVLQSPLQSPTVAGSSPLFFPLTTSPSSTPVMQGMPTPPLSTQSSIISLPVSRTSTVVPVADIPTLDMAAPQDEWTSKLGHANFRVLPEPYVPQTSDAAAVKRHLEDWESARKQFMNQAARTSEHYGPTSQIYKFTEQKWAVIDAKWKKSHDFVVQKAEANGVASPVYQTLAEPAPATKLPNLIDNTGKFPKLEDADIVGPMVQYAKISPRSSKRSAFLKFFNDLRSPSNTLR